jgi:hypothetical protein
MPTIDIVVTKRANDYHAAVEPGQWESGKTEAEAIGKLIISHSTLFGIAIILEVEPKPKVPRRAVLMGRYLRQTMRENEDD